MAMESQKAITLGFQVHGQCTWEFIAGCSLGECRTGRQLRYKSLLRQNFFNKVETQLLKSNSKYEYYQREYRGEIKQWCCEYSCASALFTSLCLPEV